MRVSQGRGMQGECRRCVARAMPPNGLELICPAEAGRLPLSVPQAGGPGAPPYGPARRVSFSELLGGWFRIGGAGTAD